MQAQVALETKRSVVEKLRAAVHISLPVAFVCLVAYLGITCHHLHG